MTLRPMATWEAILSSALIISASVRNFIPAAVEAHVVILQ
jgi:hypothetical protein